jgi:hypothetical protein
MSKRCCCPCCSGKAVRRGLLLINFLNFIFGIAFIGTGATSIAHVGVIKYQVDEMCRDWCDDIACSLQTGCDGDTRGCNCGTKQTTISFEEFSAPGAGLVAVGVFSCFVAFIGCFAATKTTNCYLLSYILIVCFIILLQFAFGIAAAVAQSPTSILMDFKHIIERAPGNTDWKTMEWFLPSRCLEVQQTYHNKTIYQPACTFDRMCRPSSIPKTYDDRYKCCDTACSTRDMDNGECACVHGDGCISGETCLYAAFFHMLTPVAGLALATLFFEVLAVCFAVSTHQAARRGEYDHQGGQHKDVEMDTI